IRSLHVTGVQTCALPFSKKLVGSLGVEVGFFNGDSTAASSRTFALDQAALSRGVGALTGPDLSRDCLDHPPIPLRAGNEELTGVDRKSVVEGREENPRYR